MAIVPPRCNSMPIFALRKLVLLVCACGWILCESRSAAFGQTYGQRDEFWRVLPDNTVAAALIPNVERLREHLSHQRTLLQIVSKQRPAIIQRLGAHWLFSQNASDFDDILNSLQQVGVMVMLKSDDDTPDHPDGAARPYEFALLAEIDDPEHWQSLWLEEILPGLQPTPSEFELGMFEFQGETLYRITSLNFQIYYTMRDHTFLATLNRDTLENLVLEFQNKAWSETAQYIATAAGNAANADLVVAFNVPVFWSALRSRMINACSPASISDGALLTALIETCQWPIAAWQVTIGDEMITERLRLWYPRPLSPDTEIVSNRNDGFFPTSSQNLPFISDRLVSDHAIYYGARHVNLAALWREFLTLREAAPEARQILIIDQWRTRLETILQTALDNLLTDLGTLEIGTAWYPAELTHRRLRQPQSLAQVPGLLMLHAEAHDKLAYVLQRIPAAFDLASSHAAFQDIEIVAYQIPFFGETQTLFHAMVDDVALFSWSDGIIKDAIRTARYGQSLAENQSYRSEAWPSRALTRGYLNLSRAASQITPPRQQSSASPDDSVIALPAMLATVAPMLWATTVEPEGFLTTSHSPLGGPGVGVFLLWWTGYLIW